MELVRLYISCTKSRIRLGITSRGWAVFQYKESSYYYYYFYFPLVLPSFSHNSFKFPLFTLSYSPPIYVKKDSETCCITSFHSYILDLFLQPSYLCSKSSQHWSQYSNLCCLLSPRHSYCLTKLCLFIYLDKYVIPLQPAVVHKFFPYTVFTAFIDFLVGLLS